MNGGRLTSEDGRKIKDTPLLLAYILWHIVTSRSIPKRTSYSVQHVRRSAPVNTSTLDSSETFLYSFLCAIYVAVHDCSSQLLYGFRDIEVRDYSQVEEFRGDWFLDSHASEAKAFRHASVPFAHLTDSR